MPTHAAPNDPLDAALQIASAFFRTKDLADLERLVALRTELDVAWVRSRIVSMMGEGDERVTAWDRIVGATRSAAP